MPKQEKIFEEIVSANLWLAEKEGDQIEGEIVEIGMNQFDKQQATIKAPSGEKFALPSYTVLTTKLGNAKIGDYVRVTYLGDEKSQKGVDYKNFKVEKQTA